MSNPDEIWCLLTSHGKLERDRGAEKLTALCNDLKVCTEPHDISSALKSSNENDLSDIFQKLSQYPISKKDTPWETKIGILIGCQVFVEAVFNLSIPESLLSPESCTYLRDTSILLLTDEEVRVRIASGDLLGTLGKKYGASIYEDSKDTVLNLIKTNMERIDSTGSKDNSLSESMDNVDNTSIPAQKIFHETAGWRHLETSMKCLQSIIDGCGQSFGENIDSDLLELIKETTYHTNRFVRETGYQTLATIIIAATIPCPTNNLAEQNEKMDTDINYESTDMLKRTDSLGAYIHSVSLAQILSNGLSDNWSQVRLAAAVASRAFLKSMPMNFSDKSKIYSLMIPRMCLNRYYLAEGVRIYSQETWRLVTNAEAGGGRKVVESYLDDVVHYYVSCTTADNHAVREAACQCIAELAAKLDKSVVKPHVDLLLDTLLECFRDDSWPVRDMACVAAGKFVLNFPNTSKRCIVKLQEFIFLNLEDPISSVRQGAALALANLVMAYEKDDSITILSDMLSKIKKSLENISTQSIEGKKYSGLDSSSMQSSFGVAKKIRDNDPELHTDQIMYSCGSLAPKMKGSGSSGGCSDCKFKKDTEPWETADGAVLLLCELSNIEFCREKITKLNLLQDVANACRFRHYVSHYFFLQTVLKTFPLVGQNLGKRVLKMYLEEFLDHIFYSAECENALASTAAYDCLKKLSDLLGPNIMRGRVEQSHSRYITILDDALNPGHGGAFDGRYPVPSIITSVRPSTAVSIPTTMNKQPSLGGTPTGSPVKN